MGHCVLGHPEIVEDSSYILVQEALTNTIRHARALSADVIIEKDEIGLHMNIRDDGRGFHVMKALDEAQSGKSSGFLGMKERIHLAGGRIEMLSADMIEAPRKGIFHPQFFTMPELITVFMAVMLTDILQICADHQTSAENIRWAPRYCGALL